MRRVRRLRWRRRQMFVVVVSLLPIKKRGDERESTHFPFGASAPPVYGVMKPIICWLNKPTTATSSSSSEGVNLIYWFTHVQRCSLYITQSPLRVPISRWFQIGWQQRDPHRSVSISIDGGAIFLLFLLKNVRKGVTNDDDDANGGCWKLEYKLTTRPTMITNSRDGFKRVAQQQTRLDRKSFLVNAREGACTTLRLLLPPSVLPPVAIHFSFLFSSF